jgi:hypothetical protein
MLQQSFHWEASHTNEQRLAALEASLGLAGLDHFRVICRERENRGLLGG